MKRTVFGKKIKLYKIKIAGWAYLTYLIIYLLRVVPIYEVDQ